jgi:Spy/CpxP family protein refolding chaperone
MKSMKTMFVAVLVAGSLIAGGSALLAQDAPNPPPAGGPPGGGMRGGRGPSIELLTTNLVLTEAQIPKVKAVLDDQQKKMTDMRADASVAPADRGAKMQEIRTATTAKMKEILTPEQFAKYEKLPVAGGRRGGGGGPGGPGGGAPPPAPAPAPGK